MQRIEGEWHEAANSVSLHGHLGVSRIITSLLRIDTYMLQLPEESGSSLLVMPSISLLSRGQTRYVKSTT